MRTARTTTSVGIVEKHTSTFNIVKISIDVGAGNNRARSAPRLH